MIERFQHQNVCPSEERLARYYVDVKATIIPVAYGENGKLDILSQGHVQKGHGTEDSDQKIEWP